MKNDKMIEQIMKLFNSKNEVTRFKAYSVIKDQLDSCKRCETRWKSAIKLNPKTK